MWIGDCFYGVGILRDNSKLLINLIYKEWNYFFFVNLGMSGRKKVFFENFGWFLIGFVVKINVICVVKF